MPISGSPQGQYSRQYILGEIIPKSVTSSNMNNVVTLKHPTNAFDKQLNTRTRADPDESGKIWIEADLGKEYFVHGIMIIGRYFEDFFYSASYCVKDDEHYRDCLDTEKDVHIGVLQEGKVEECGMVSMNYGQSRLDQTYVVYCNKNARGIKLFKDTGKIFALEIVILTDGKIYNH